MKTGRFSSILTWAVVLNFLLFGTAFAGFGFSFGGDDTGKSGLDFYKGYDINTVATISGRVVSLPRTVEQEHTIVEINADGKTINLSLGPRSFWEKQGFQLRINDEVIVKGSKTQGKDGKTYLITQKLTNKTTSSQVVLRNDKGSPSWLGTVSNRLDGSTGNKGGGMMRDSGMMRGGGGMMRH